MKRSRLIKCLTVTKANFRIRTTCYLFFIVFCSVFFSLSFSCCRCCFFFTSCSVDCVYVLWTSLFSVCASNTIDTAGFHTFFCLIFQNRMHAVRTENIFRVKIWICFRSVRFFFLLFFRFEIFFLAFAPYSVSKRLCKNWRKKTYAQNHSYCSGSISAAQIFYKCCTSSHNCTFDAFFGRLMLINCRPHRTTN